MRPATRGRAPREPPRIKEKAVKWPCVENSCRDDKMTAMSKRVRRSDQRDIIVPPCTSIDWMVLPIIVRITLVRLVVHRGWFPSSSYLSAGVLYL
jgi:hypothetical protein